MGSGLHARVPPASPCPWVAHPVSGRLVATEIALSDSLSLRLRLSPGLASPRPHTRRLILQKARRHTEVTPHAPTGRKHMVSGSISLPSPGCFSPFPHGTGPLSVASGSYALGGGPPGFPPDSACPAVLTCTTHPHAPAVAYGTLTRCGGPFQQPSADWRAQRRGVCRPLSPCRPTPREHRRQPVPPARFGLCPFRSPLLRASSRFLGVLRCFSSPGAPRTRVRCAGMTRRGLPHSETSGSQAPSASPERFAAWARPSSAAGA